MVVVEYSAKMGQRKWKEAVSALGVVRISVPLVAEGRYLEESYMSNCSEAGGLLDAEKAKAMPE